MRGVSGPRPYCDENPRKFHPARILENENSFKMSQVLDEATDWWSAGVVECWRNGIRASRLFNTPVLQHSITPFPSSEAGLASGSVDHTGGLEQTGGMGVPPATRPKKCLGLRSAPAPEAQGGSNQAQQGQRGRLRDGSTKHLHLTERENVRIIRTRTIGRARS